MVQLDTLIGILTIVLWLFDCKVWNRLAVPHKSISYSVFMCDSCNIRMFANGASKGKYKFEGRWRRWWL